MANWFNDRERQWRRYEGDLGRDEDYDEPRWRGSGYRYDPEGRYGEPTWRRYGPEGYSGEPIRRGYDFNELGWESYYGEPIWRGPGRGGYYGQDDDWMTPGPYTGRGPRGYRRSDERICEEVCQRLTYHGEIDASNIDVTVNNGEVTLEGTVSSRHDKRLAEDIAESVMGVEDVHNRLGIKPLGWTEGMGGQRQLDSKGWAEGQGRQPHDSEGWVEGLGHQVGESEGWTEGMAEKER